MNRMHANKVKAATLALMVKGEDHAVEEFFAPDYVVHLTGKDLGGGHRTVRKVMDLYRNAFPDMRVKIEILVSSKDRIAWQRTVTATHNGSFKGFPATGRRIKWRDMITSRFKKGRIAEEWFITDLAEQLLLARKCGPKSFPA